MIKLPNCVFVSVWDGDTEVRSNAHYDPATGAISNIETHESGEWSSLDREFIEFGEDEIEVCKECHEFTLKPAMKANPNGPDLIEATECRNPDCDNKL